MAIVAALAAILIWASLATLGVSLAAVPPLLLIGSSLLIGGALSIPWAKRWNLRWTSIGIDLLRHAALSPALRAGPAPCAAGQREPGALQLADAYRAAFAACFARVPAAIASCGLCDRRLRRRRARDRRRSDRRLGSVGVGLRLCRSRCSGVIDVLTRPEAHGRIVHC